MHERNLREESIKQEKNFSILKPYEFLNDFAREASKSTNRVWIQSMLFEVDEIFGKASNQLQQAATKGVHAELHVDHFSLLVVDGKFKAFPSLTKEKRIYKNEVIKNKENSLDSLYNSGVNIIVTNPPTPLQKFIPSIGRNHIKMAIVDNIAWVGGLNITAHDFGREDFMMRIDDNRIVQALAEQFKKINMNKPKQNYETFCTEDTRLVVDAGIKGNSLILDIAVDLVKKSQTSVRLTSQYTPDNKMLNALIIASYGADVQVINSDFKYIDELMPKVFEVKNRIAAGLKNKPFTLISYPNWMHAKVLIIDREHLNNAVAIVGTHNFMTSGVKFGTEEIALISTNPTFIHNLSSYYDKLYATVENK